MLIVLIFALLIFSIIGCKQEVVNQVYAGNVVDVKYVNGGLASLCFTTVETDKGFFVISSYWPNVVRGDSCFVVTLKKWDGEYQYLRFNSLSHMYRI